jgi:hypothetical protein
VSSPASEAIQLASDRFEFERSAVGPRHQLEGTLVRGNRGFAITLARERTGELKVETEAAAISGRHVTARQHLPPSSDRLGRLAVRDQHLHQVRGVQGHLVFGYVRRACVVERLLDELDRALGVLVVERELGRERETAVEIHVLLRQRGEDGRSLLRTRSPTHDVGSSESAAGQRFEAPAFVGMLGG